MPSKKEVVVTEDHGGLVLDADQRRWTEDQLAALHAMGVSEETSPAELEVFRHVAQRTGLDPFARQIYLISRKDRVNVDGQWSDVYKATIQTGIDGYRVVARRAADRANGTLEYEDTLWCGSDGVWRDVWLDAGPPSAAKVTVLRDGKRFSAVALFVEYAQRFRDRRTDEMTLTKMWAERGAGQLAKCAEALALRKAYPHDLSGLYTDDEMAAADNPPVVQGVVEEDPDAGDLGAALTIDPRLVAIGDEFKRLQYPHDGTRRERIAAIVGRDIPMDPAIDPDLTSDEIDKVLEELRIEPEPEG